MSVQAGYEVTEDQGEAHEQSTHGRRADVFTGFLVVLVLASNLTMCVVLGFRRISMANSWQTTVNQLESTIPYGMLVPFGGLELASGRTLTPQMTRGHWTTFVFFDPTCSSCTSELDSLAHDQQVRRSFQIVPVMTNVSIAAFAKSSALQYEHIHRLPFDIGIDASGAVAKAFHATELMPYSVTLDPEGRVRLATHGPRQTADALRSFLTGEENSSLSMTSWRHIKPFTGLKVSLTPSGGLKETLAQMSQDKVVILTFLTSRGDLDKRRTENVLQYTSAPNVRLIFVTSGLAEDDAVDIRKSGALVLTSDTGPIVSAFKDYKVASGPVSIILYKGRVVAAEDGPQLLGPEVFENVLAYSVFLSSSSKLTK